VTTPARQYRGGEPGDADDDHRDQPVRVRVGAGVGKAHMTPFKGLVVQVEVFARPGELPAPVDRGGVRQQREPLPTTRASSTRLICPKNSVIATGSSQRPTAAIANADTCHRQPSQAAKISAVASHAVWSSFGLSWTTSSSRPLRTSCSPPFSSRPWRRGSPGPRRRLPLHGSRTGCRRPASSHPAHRRTRTTASGRLVLLADQDRARWDRVEIDEGLALIRSALERRPAARYALMAAIAAAHAAAPRWEATDWQQIAGLYDTLTPDLALPRGGPQPRRRHRRSQRPASRACRLRPASR
jgi:hypothetical protein